MGETNTLVLSGLEDELLKSSDFIKELQRKVISHVPCTDVIQFIILKSLKRVVLIFNNKDSASKLYSVFKKENKEFVTGFSLSDYNGDIQDNYLKLPENSRMFLISPPASPPSNFDYDQEEEEPNKSQIYTHQEIQESLLKYNKELKELLEKNDKDQLELNDTHWDQLEQKEIVLNDNHDNSQTPMIILHPIKGHNDHLISHAIQSFKTSLPSRSIFDDLSDNEYDDDDDEDM
jgi:hypothetical protein